MADDFILEGARQNGSNKGVVLSATYIGDDAQGRPIVALNLSGTIAGGALATKQDTQITAEQAILAKIIAAPATEAKQDTGNTALAAVQTATEKVIPATLAEAVTASDSTMLTATRALFVGTGGDVAVTMAGGGDVTFTNVPNGTLLPISVTKVLATGTDGADIVALR